MRIVLVDDNDLLRRSVRAAFERRGDVEIVADVATGAEALERVADLLPDVALIDVNMPGMGGAECAHSITSRFPGVHVVAWSGETAAVAQMLDAGASGYLLKGSPPDQLIDALKALVNRNPVDAGGHERNDRQGPGARSQGMLLIAESRST